MGKKKKKKKGIRYIKSIKFLRGKIFQTRKRDAKKSQKIFQDRNHLTRIFPAKKDKKKGYYLYYSEERIRKRKRKSVKTKTPKQKEKYKKKVEKRIRKGKGIGWGW